MNRGSVIRMRKILVKNHLVMSHADAMSDSELAKSEDFCLFRGGPGKTTVMSSINTSQISFSLSGKPGLSVWLGEPE